MLARRAACCHCASVTQVGEVLMTLDCPPLTTRSYAMRLFPPFWTKKSCVPRVTCCDVTKLVPQNAEHNLGTVNIRSGFRCGKHVRAFPMIFCIWNYRSEPIFRRRSQCDVKTPSYSFFETAVHKQRNAVQHLSASTRAEPNFFASESFPWL